MSDQSTPATKPLEQLWVWLQRQLGQNAAVLLLFAGLLLVVGAKGSDKLEEIATKKAGEQVDPVKRQVDEHEQRLKHHSEDLHQTELDMRELYKVLPTIRRSERLEHPWPSHDGGEP